VTSAYLSFDGFEKELQQEITRYGGKVQDRTGRLIIASDLAHPPVWAQNIWHNPQWISFDSVSQAAAQLKELGPLWANYSSRLHRRSELIQEKIHRFKPKPLEFLKPPPQKKFGAWTLWDDKKILASGETNSVLPLGEAHFKESKVPPSRAYLKLWEVFTVHGVKIPEKSIVVDLGSSPGGWTWVLSDLTDRVISVDKAALDAKVTAKKNVEYLKKDAFTLDPASLATPYAMFSDIICEPRRLYDLVQTWMSTGCERFVCTIKFKGATDFDITEKFLAIPDSRVVHLFANKHEITWIKGL